MSLVTHLLFLARNLARKKVLAVYVPMIDYESSRRSWNTIYSASPCPPWLLFFLFFCSLLLPAHVGCFSLRALLFCLLFNFCKHLYPICFLYWASQTYHLTLLKCNYLWNFLNVFIFLTLFLPLSWQVVFWGPHSFSSDSPLMLPYQVNVAMLSGLNGFYRSCLTTQAAWLALLMPALMELLASSLYDLWLL